MTFLNRKSFKTIAAFGTMVFLMSCTNDLITSTDGLIDNDFFVRDTINAEDNIFPVLETVAIDSVPTVLLSTYLLGEYTNSSFGTVNAGFVTQVNADRYPVRRTTNSNPENVTSTEVTAFLEIPLTMNAVSNTSADLELTNAIGDFSTVFNFKVSTFETFLEQLNANNNTRIYYSNGTNNAGTKEDLGTLTELGTLTSYNFQETYTEADTLRIPLDVNYFTTNFLELLDENPILTPDEMRVFFKGLKVEATKVSGNGLLVPLNLSRAKLKIKYTNEEIGGSEIPVELSFSLNGALYNLYNHNHNKADIANEVYMQGASGYHVKVDLASLIANYSTISKNEKWLINQARLKIYLKEEIDGDYKDVVTNFLIYAVNANGEAVALEDYFYRSNFSFVDGTVRFEDVENRKKPYVQFFITKFIKDALEDGEILELRIKESLLETTRVNLSSNTAKGAVFLNGLTDATKKPQFELVYSFLK